MRGDPEERWLLYSEEYLNMYPFDKNVAKKKKHACG
jgi:hypothetical protein